MRKGECDGMFVAINALSGDVTGNIWIAPPRLSIIGSHISPTCLCNCSHVRDEDDAADDNHFHFHLDWS